MKPLVRQGAIAQFSSSAALFAGVRPLGPKNKVPEFSVCDFYSCLKVYWAIDYTLSDSVLESFIWFWKIANPILQIRSKRLSRPPKN